MEKPADSFDDSWVYRLLPERFWPFAQLARWDRPIGWQLLLWPCWWSMALAMVAASALSAEGAASAAYSATRGDPAVLLACFIAFALGAIAMRGAGCTYNDLMDADIDAQVARTARRPLPAGHITRKGAAIFMVGQLFAGFLVLLGLAYANPLAFVLGILSLPVIALYPFAKRWTSLAQLFLGIAFAWGALMGWIAVFETLHPAAFFLYGGCVLWTIGYDTIYAHQDKEEDAVLGLKSTARLFDAHTKPALGALYGGAILFFALAFFGARAGAPAFAGLIMGAAHLIGQIFAFDRGDREKCLTIFRANNLFGWLVFAGLMADYGLRE